MHTPGKSFTNDEHKETPGGYVNTNRDEINTVYELPKKNSNLNELEEKLKRFDFKYHCNFCPYFCFYKLYFSKTEKKIYISIHCENNSFHKEFLSLEEFLNRKETKFVKSLNICNLCKTQRTNFSEDFFLCTKCSFTICKKCEAAHSEDAQFLINTKDIFKNICIIHVKPLLVFCKKCKKPFCIECKCQHDDFDKRDIKAFKLEEKDLKVIMDKLNNKNSFVKNLENEVYKLQNHPNFNELKNNYENYKKNNQLLIQFIKELIDYFCAKSEKHHQLYEITQNLYNIVRFSHLQLPEEYNKPGNDNFNTLNNYFGMRGSFIIIMEKKIN
jgi:hypothetical protein